MNNSHLVWAEKFKLLELKSVKDGTYNEKGSKKSEGSSLVLRSYAESRNAVENNEIYVFDEKKTSELMKIREENISKQAAGKEKKKISSEDALANALAKALGKQNQVVDVKEITTQVTDFTDLKEIIRDEDLGIRIGKDDSRDKIESKIIEARAKQ